MNSVKRTDMIAQTYLGKMVISLPMLYLGLTAIPFIEVARQFLEISVLGFSMSTLLLIFAVVMFDFVTGLVAAKYEGEKLKSSKGLKTVYKLISYFLTMWAISMLEDMCVKNNVGYAEYILNYFRIALFSLAFLWEFYSIGENIERRTGNKPKIFSFLDKITKLLEKRMNDSIEKGTSKLDELINAKKDDKEDKAEQESDERNKVDDHESVEPKI